jgi:hypothetical protein
MRGLRGIDLDSVPGNMEGPVIRIAMSCSEDRAWS